MLAVRIVAVTCVPTDAPTERTSALKPSPRRSATAGPPRRSGSASRRRRARSRTNISALKSTISAGCRARRRAAGAPSEAMQTAAASGTLLPKRAPRMPDSGPSTSISSDAGEHQQARAGRVEPEPVPGRGRRLRELRDQDERAEHPEADEQRREVRHQHGRRDERGDVGQRLLGPALQRDPAREDDEAARRSARASAATPQPQREPGDRDQRQRRARRRARPRRGCRPGPGVRIGDSGTSSWAATAAATAHDRADQKIQW